MGRYRTTPLDCYGDPDAGEEPTTFESIDDVIRECFPDGDCWGGDLEAIMALEPGQTYVLGGGAAACWMWERLD